LQKYRISETHLHDRCRRIKQRCLNKNNKAYHNYGGRGISLHPEWQNDYAKMIDYILSIGYTDELTIDRIDNNGNYEPGNLRMATRAEQNRNSRACKLTELDVKEIRYLIDQGKLRQRTIGNLFGITSQVVYRIKSGITWG
jgi:hypothetical protein